MHSGYRMGGGLGFSVTSLRMICVASQASLHFNAPRSMFTLVIGWDLGLWLFFTSGHHLVKPGNASPSQICSEESRRACVLCAGDQSNEIEHVDNQCDIQRPHPARNSNRVRLIFPYDRHNDKPPNEKKPQSKPNGNKDGSDHDDRVEGRFLIRTTQTRDGLNHHQACDIVHHRCAAQDDTQPGLCQSRRGQDGECGSDTG